LLRHFASVPVFTPSRAATCRDAMKVIEHHLLMRESTPLPMGGGVTMRNKVEQLTR
jgi:hypothetical protein